MATFQANRRDVSGKRHTANFDTTSEADIHRQERLRERRRGGTGDPTGGKLTVAQWWDRWSDTRQVTSSTRAREQSIWACQIEPRFGSIRLADLRRSDARVVHVAAAQNGTAGARRTHLGPTMTKHQIRTFWAEHGAGGPARWCLLGQASVLPAPARPLQDGADGKDPALADDAR